MDGSIWFYMYYIYTVENGIVRTADIPATFPAFSHFL